MGDTPNYSIPTEESPGTPNLAHLIALFPPGQSVRPLVYALATLLAQIPDGTITYDMFTTEVKDRFPLNFRAGQSLPVSADVGELFLFTVDNAAIYNAVDTDGVTVKASAKALDLFEYQTTNKWKFLGGLLYNEYNLRRIGSKNISISTVGEWYETDVDASNYLNENYMLFFQVTRSSAWANLMAVMGDDLAAVTAASAGDTYAASSRVDISCASGTYAVGRKSDGELLFTAADVADDPTPLRVFVQRVEI